MPEAQHGSALRPPRPVQYRGAGERGGDAHAVAARGVSGAGGALPHGDAIQASFGRHDVGHVRAHTDREATAALGAEAYATGDRVAFAGAPTLHTAAHEAAHVVQQRAGVALAGGVGARGDKYEQHADRVADAVVQGKSAEPILDEMAGSGGGAATTAVQREEAPTKVPTIGDIVPGPGSPIKDPNVPTIGDIEPGPGSPIKTPTELATTNGNLRSGTQYGASSSLKIDQGGITTTNTATTNVRGGGGGYDQKTTEERKNGDAPTKTDTLSSDKDAKPKNLKPDVKTTAKAKVAEKKLAEWDALAKQYSTTIDVGGGFTFTASCKLGHAAAKIAGDISANLGDVKDNDGKKKNTGGLEANAGIEAKANLFEFTAKLEGKYEPTLLGEQVSLALYIALEGEIGVSAMGKLQAAAGQVATEAKDTTPSASAMLGGEAFAGAKIKAAVGARFDWKKKPQASYVTELTSFFNALVVLAADMTGPAGMAALALKDLLLGDSVEQYLAEMVQKLYDWGPSGAVPLIKLEGSLEGSAGAGIKGKLEAGFKQGAFTFVADGSITVGIGGGGAIAITLDAVNLPLFAMVVGGKLINYIKAYALTKLTDILPESVRGIVEDDAAVAQVEAGYHEALSATERAALIDKIVDIHVGNSSENAIITVFRTSAEKGDLYEVVKAMKTDTVALFSAIDNANFHESLNSVLSSLNWVTCIGDVHYVDCDEVYMDDPGSGPYMYFYTKQAADRTAAGLTMTTKVEKSVAAKYKDTPDNGYFLAMPGFQDKVESFYGLDSRIKGSQELKARFKWVSAAWGYRTHGGIWAEKR